MTGLICCQPSSTGPSCSMHTQFISATAGSRSCSSGCPAMQLLRGEWHVLQPQASTRSLHLRHMRATCAVLHCPTAARPGARHRGPEPKAVQPLRTSKVLKHARCPLRRRMKGSNDDLHPSYIKTHIPSQQPLPLMFDTVPLLITKQEQIRAGAERLVFIPQSAPQGHR